MLYRLNFNGKEIPERPRKAFPRTMIQEGTKLHLSGVANSDVSLEVALDMANNGRRMIAVETLVLDGTKWYGIYTG